MSLPALVVFSVRDSNNEVRYLSFTGPQRQLRCGTEEGVYSDNVNFVVEPAGDGLVHIRSCYENCYWTRASRFEAWLLASSPEKVEDMSKDECTLFRPRMTAGNVSVGFVHAQSGLNVVMRPSTDAHAYNLCVEPGAPTDFSFLDFAHLSKTKLPKYVMFLGDNNRYLSPKSTLPDWAFLHFAEYDNPTSRDVGFEVFYNKNGDILRFKSMSLNNFWHVMLPGRRVLITPYSSGDMSFDAAVSSPQNASEDGIALRSLTFNQYCHRVSSAEQEYFAGLSTPHTLNAWLRPRYVASPGKGHVNIESFRNAWKGPKGTRFLKEELISNSEFQERETILPTEYQARKTTTISNSFALVKGHPTVFNGQMPSVLATGELDIPDMATDVIASWGLSATINVPTKEDVKIVLPPRSSVRVTLSVNRATYEVPFSYQQIDDFPFGGTETQNLHDGVFKIESEYRIGVSYNIQQFSSKEGNPEDDIKPNKVVEVNKE
ncbi:uncharacterized protein LOC141610534 [Silene latifolia]|uniref:uncharacterized protein LOC141610534 n=1 Tax=Silene latifolia TaxID=37657 RepID=UPI003D773F6E